MIIKVYELKEGEIREVQQDYDAKKLDVEFEDLVYAGPVKMRGQIEKTAETLRFWGSLSGEMDQTCGRGLKVDRNKFNKDFDFFYDIQGITSLDVTDDLRETLILEHPMVYTCHEGRRGQCHECDEKFGKLKSEERRQKPNNPFEVLKTFMNRKKEK